MSSFQHIVGVILFWAAVIALIWACVLWFLRDWPEPDEADHD